MANCSFLLKIKFTDKTSQGPTNNVFLDKTSPQASGK